MPNERRNTPTGEDKMGFKFATDSEVGTIEAASFDAACEKLQAMVSPAAAQNGGWGWVEDVDGNRFEIGKVQ